ncbi:MAG: TonB-dependent receptor plug domain-containing protein [Pseudomonadota bacterium]
MQQVSDTGLVVVRQATPVVDRGALVLDELTVTARRSEEPLSDVPQSVHVLDDLFLDRSAIDSASEAFNNIPNVNFTGGASPGFLQPSIRGVSNLIGDGATSPAVDVFVDGQIVNPASGLQGITAQGNTLDLERIETVFGPQNITFGRGTIGDAINFVTKKPTDQFEA